MKVTPPEGRVGAIDEGAAFFQNELLWPTLKAMRDKASYGASQRACFLPAPPKIAIENMLQLVTAGWSNADRGVANTH